MVYSNPDKIRYLYQVLIHDSSSPFLEVRDDTDSETN